MLQLLHTTCIPSDNTFDHFYIYPRDNTSEHIHTLGHSSHHLFTLRQQFQSLLYPPDNSSDHIYTQGNSLYHLYTLRPPPPPRQYFLILSITCTPQTTVHTSCSPSDNSSNHIYTSRTILPSICNCIPPDNSSYNLHELLSGNISMLRTVVRG